MEGEWRASVSWDIVCKPKSEGGLGLKDIQSWNQACIIQHIRAILMQAGSGSRHMFWKRGGWCRIVVGAGRNCRN